MDTNKYKSVLEEQKSEMEKQLAALKKDQERTGGAVSADFAEQATETENDEVVDALSGHDVETLNLINSALTRIENGSFGTCANCGESIEEKRLDAVPYAVNCMNCA
jgi:DnaK suppressor protein